MAFLTIHVAPGLAPAARRRARLEGPRAVDSRSDHGSLLRSAGFDVDIDRDVTGAFLDTARAWLREATACADDLERLQPAGGFDEQQDDRGRMIGAIEDGVLRRSLFVASKRRR